MGRGSYAQAAAGLGPDRTAEWLCDARETDELAVRAAFRGTRLAAELREAVTADAPEGRAWLLTSARSPRAMAFYRRLGLTPATHPSPEVRASPCSSAHAIPPGPWRPFPRDFPESLFPVTPEPRPRTRSSPPPRGPADGPAPAEPTPGARVRYHALRQVLGAAARSGSPNLPPSP